MIYKVLTRLQQQFFKDYDKPWHNPDTAGSHLLFTWS